MLPTKKLREGVWGIRPRNKEQSHALDLLAALSQRTDLAVGCYCEDERRCHRSLLRELLRERRATLA
mgnify:CR=1 FL=1